MRAGVVVAMCALVGTAAWGATKLAPNEIQTTFFNGQAFTAATPSGVKFKMVFTADGKVTREPVAKVGAKGEGTWKVTGDGFCTTWKGGKPTCFIVMAAGPNTWSVMKSTTIMAVWSK